MFYIRVFQQEWHGRSQAYQSYSMSSAPSDKQILEAVTVTPNPSSIVEIEDDNGNITTKDLAPF